MGILILISSIWVVLLYDIIWAIQAWGPIMTILLIPWIGLFVLVIELDKRFL